MKAIIPLRKLILLLLFSLQLLGLPCTCTANQASSLSRLIKSRRSEIPPKADPWSQIDMMVQSSLSSVHIGPQDGLMQADKIVRLPGQPDGVNFDQYAGYVTVDPKAGRSLFYYFVESSQNSSTKPLVLWLNGGPGCSSLGYGAMEELGPFRVNNDGKTLSLNPFAWNKVANVLFLETPAGVGYSYSNTSSDYFRAGDKTTAQDSYTFLINWFERFPQYKTRDFFITGESYAGHYVPQLAYTIVTNNKIRNRSTINLKGVAIGNAWMDDNLCEKGIYDFVWSHALISDETHAAINKYCDYASGILTNDCGQYQDQADSEYGKLDIYNIYAPSCDLSSSSGSRTSYSIHDFDPCSDDYVNSYLNLAEVQEAFHARSTKWEACRHFPWNDSPDSMIPTIKQLIASNINIWIYSGDTDGRVPVTSSRYVAQALNLTIENAWRPWYCNNQVGGYVVGYKKGLTLATVRGAGHEVPSYQPERALTMISSFLQGLSLPPA